MFTRVRPIETRLFLFGLWISLATAACQREGAGPAAATQPPGDAGAPRTAVFALYTDIKDWDPASGFTAEIDLFANVYETLVRYQPPGSATQLAPGLATDWSASADGTRWTFHLRRGVRFHDGSTFDAAAAKAALDRTRKLGLGAAYIWSAVTAIEAPAPDTLVIETAYPAPIDLIASSQYGAYIYSEAAARAGADWFLAGRADGTGPYRVAGWQPGQQVVLERNDEYWGGWGAEGGGGVFDRVLLRAVQSPTTQLQMLRGGEADVISIAPVDMLVRALEEPGIDATFAPSWVNVIVQLNTRSYPTDNVLFRRALTHAWDYEAINRHIYYGRSRRAHGIIPDGMWGYDPDLAMPAFDLEEARRLLEASGVPRDDWHLTLTYNSVSEEYKNIAKVFQRNLAKIGVRLTLHPGPWGMIWSEAKNLRTAPQAFLMVWWPTYPSPADWLTGLFSTEKTPQYNLSHYSNPAFDRLVAEGVALEAVERDRAIEKYRRAQALLVEQAVAIFVGDFDDRVIHRSDLEGISLNPAYRTVMFHPLRRRDGRVAATP